MRLNMKKKIKKLIKILTLSVSLTLICLNLKISAAHVHFIPVDKGDCELIVDSNETMLIDCGEVDQGARIADYLQKLGIKSIDYFIATHPHSDHIGGFTDLAKKIKVKNIIEPEIPSRLTTPMHWVYSEFLECADKNNIKIKKAEVGKQIKLGKSKLKILGPVKPYNYKNLNNCSIVAKLITEDNFKFLFCGDAQDPAELDLMESGQNLSANVFKLNHHGGLYNPVDKEKSNSIDFLKAVNPQICVATATKNDKTGDQPNMKLLKALNNMQIKTYRTDLDGPIVFKAENDRLEIYSKNGRKVFKKEAK